MKNQTTIENPYKKTGSVAYKAFEMAKAGTSKDELIQLCAAEDIGPARLFREFKLEDFRNVKWSYSEDEAGKIKITMRGSLKKTKPVAETKPAKITKPAEVKESKPTKADKRSEKMVDREAFLAHRRELAAKRRAAKKAAVVTE